MPFFELFMYTPNLGPKDELHQWYTYIHSILQYVLLRTDFYRYLGLFGDHIVPAVLYRYAQVLLHPDLVSKKGKPLVTMAKVDV